MKKSMWITLGLVLALLAGVSCSSPAPAPTTPAATSQAPAPKPTSQPTTSSPTAPTSKPPTTSAAPTYTWKMTTSYTGDHIYMAAIREWVNIVQEASQGRIKITSYEGSSLTAAANELQAVRTGLADVTFTPWAYYTGVVPSVPVMTLKIDKEVWKKSANIELTPLFQQGHAAVGVQFFYCTSFNPYILTTTKPVNSREDLKGKMIRTAGGILGAQAVAIGGTPVTTTWSEIPDAMQKGTVDGAWTSGRTYLTNKLERVAKYVYYDKDAVNIDMAPIINKAKYDALPDDLKKMITDKSLEVGNRGVDRAYGDTDAWMATMKAVGVTLIPMPEEWIKIMKERGRDAYLAAAKTDADKVLNKKIWDIFDKYTLPKL